MSDANLVTIVDLVNSLDDYTLHLINNLKVREKRFNIKYENEIDK